MRRGAAETVLLSFRRKVMLRRSGLEAIVSMYIVYTIIYTYIHIYIINIHMGVLSFCARGKESENKYEIYIKATSRARTREW